MFDYTRSESKATVGLLRKKAKMTDENMCIYIVSSVSCRQAARDASRDIGIEVQ